MEINGKLGDYIKIVVASADLTLTIGSQGSCILNFTTPNGYTPILATPYSANGWDWVWSTCALDSSTNSVYAVIKWATTVAGNDSQTYNIKAFVICVKS